MLRDGQSKAMENMTKVNPMATMPGFDAMRAQQEAFLQAMTGGMMGHQQNEETPQEPSKEGDLDDIKAQLKAMQDKLSKMGK